MNYCKIIENDSANGVGIRVSLFVSGCRHHCEGCFQPETWDFSYGTKLDNDAWRRIYQQLERWEINGLTILGGEPMEPENVTFLMLHLRYIKERYPKKTVWVYTGCTWEELHDKYNVDYYSPIVLEMLNYVDVLVDGRFEQDKKQLGLRFRGSTNQRIINVPASNRAGHVVLWTDVHDLGIR